MRNEILLNQIEGFRNYTMIVIDSLPQDIVHIVPKGYNNNILWNMGHLYLDQYLWIYHKIDDPLPVPDYYNDLFGFGSRPSEWKIEPPSFAELRELLIEQPKIIRQTFSHRLDEPLNESSELGMSTIGDVIPRTLYHEGLHEGAIIALKNAILNNVND